MSLPTEFNSSFTPQLSASTLLTERCWLIGLLFLGISYGVLVTLAIFSLRLLWQSITPSNRHRKLGWIAIVVFLLFTGTVYPATVTELTVLAFSTYRDVDGGPVKIENMLPPPGFALAGLACFVMTTWLCDGIMVWRFTVLYRASSTRALAALVFVPCLAWFATLTLGTMWLVQNAHPAIPFGFDTTGPFFMASFALNSFVSVGLIIRLLTFRRRIAATLTGISRSSAQYTNIANMLVEAAIPYTLFSVACLVTFITQHPLRVLVNQPFGSVQIISTLMIIFRVAIGTAWSSTTMSDLSTLQAASRSQSGGRIETFVLNERSTSSHHDSPSHGKDKTVLV